jgi:hypothetical protein
MKYLSIPRVKIHSGTCFRIFCCLILVFIFSGTPTSFATEDSKSIRRSTPETALGGADIGVGELYAIVVGISEYKHPKVPKLRLSDKDARDFADFLTTQKGVFRNTHLSVLLNKEATSAEVRSDKLAPKGG